MATDRRGDQVEALARTFGVTPRSVWKWIERGMPRDPEAAAEWVRVNINPEPNKGGKIPGAGRPKGAKDKRPRIKAGAVAATNGQAPAPQPATTRAEVDLARLRTKMLREAMEFEEVSGRLVPADEIEAAWGEVLQAFKTNLDDLPRVVESDAGAALRLTQQQGATIRRIITDRINAAFEQLVAAYGGRPG